MAKLNANQIASEVLKAIGGSENIISASHCATRLRLVVSDSKKVNKATVEQVDGVKGAFEASGQIQIIFGTGVVNKVYDEFAILANIQVQTKDDVKKAAMQKQNIFFRAIKMLGDIFIPIIPAIVASGLLMGLMDGLPKVFPELLQNDTYTLIQLFSNAAFVFLPILIAMSAGKVFGANIYLSAVIGMVLIHPNLMNAWSVASAEVIPTTSVWFGLYDIQLVGYQGHVVPVVVAIFLLSVIEKKLHKVVPEMFDLFVTPLVSVLLTSYITLTTVGPIFVTIENWILSGALYLISIPLGIGAAIAGGLYGVTVVGGVHHMYNALEAGLLSSTGVNAWMPIATAANVAQGGAALAVALKSRDKKIKAMALPASLSAFMGITEPAIFGVNLRFIKPFVCACIAAAFGGIFASITGIVATAYGITGIFGILITGNHLVQYLLLMVISAGIAFALSWFTHKDQVAETSADNTLKPADEGGIIAPLEGKISPISEMNDETFASGVLGKGVMITPTGSNAIAPFDGTVEMIFPTSHAVALKSNDGVELLIHIGINTVELDGKYFKAFVQSGQTVSKGQKLISFEIEEIKKAGYDISTAVTVTNSDEVVFDLEKALIKV